MPWRTSANEQRSCEEVRPIYWSARPKSYMLRTRDWDDFPNGRWGDSSSPAYGSLSDYYLFAPPASSKTSLVQEYGTPEQLQDVYQVFHDFVVGSGGVKRLPWVEDALDAETSELEPMLSQLNSAGFCTINSQPAANGVSSTDQVHGWGGPDGFIYKKAYVEFFCDRHHLEVLLSVMKDFPMMNYHALNHDGSIRFANVHEASPNAVTWGVFPCREIIQPTVADPISFPIWKDEAFELWKSQWQSLYDEGSKSWNLLQEVHDSFFLVSVVDNNYIESSLEQVFKLAIEQLENPSR